MNGELCSDCRVSLSFSFYFPNLCDMDYEAVEFGWSDLDFSQNYGCELAIVGGIYVFM